MIVGSSLVRGSNLARAAAGGFVDSLGDRGLFVARAGLGAIATLFIIRLVPETLARHEELGEGSVIERIGATFDHSTVR